MEPAPAARSRDSTAPVATSVTVVADDASPRARKANHVMRRPPRSSAEPWMRSAQTAAFSPPAATYSMAMSPMPRAGVNSPIA